MEKLNPAEKKWVKQVNELLAKCPSTRIGFYTIGDSSVMLYDCSRDAEVDAELVRGRGEFCGAVRNVGADFEEIITFPNAVQSTAG